MQSIIYVIPEIFLSLSIMTLLILGVFVKKSFKIINALTILSLILGIALIFNLPKEVIKVFNDSYIIDEFSIFMKVLTLLFCLFVFNVCHVFIPNKRFAKFANDIGSFCIGHLRTRLYTESI